MSEASIESLFKDGKLSVITFSTIDASFAIPLDQVLYIEKDVKRNIQLNELDQFNHEVITFQNNTVQLYDFNRLIGSENHQEAMQQFVRSLDAMEQELNDWLEALQECLITDAPFGRSLDPNKSESIKWLKEFSSENEELNEIIEKMHAPITKLFEAAKSILILNKTDSEQAVKTAQLEKATTFAELSTLFQLAKERAEASIRPIILFVEHIGGKVTALRLDNINDIETYTRKCFSWDDSTAGVMKNKHEDFHIEGYLRKGDTAPLMLINCQSNQSE